MIEKSKQFKRFLSTAPGKLLLGILVLAVLTVTTVTVYAVGGVSYTVTVLDADKTVVVESDSADPNDILASAGVKLSANDTFKTADLGSEDAVVEVLREMKITLKDGGESKKVTVTARTVEDALKNVGITVSSNDVTTPSLESVIEDGDTVSIDRAARVTVSADGMTYYCQSENNTVAELLELNGITLGADDEVSPKATKVVKTDTDIKVSRVTYETVTKTEKVKFKTVKKNDATLPVGKTKVKRNGVNGRANVTYKVKYVNGEKDSKKAVKKVVTKKPVSKIVLVGTKGAPTGSQVKAADGYFIDNTGKKVKYKTSYTGSATAYTSADCGGSTTTASGMKVAVGRVAVNPRLIPYGTKLYITGYGYAVAADTGGFVYNSNTIVDLYMNTRSECISWGRRTVTMYVLA